YRLATARRTANSETINANDIDPVEAIRAMTEGRGADVCVDAVGLEADRSLKDKLANIWHAEVGSFQALRTAISAVRRGGYVSVLGVYGVPYDNFPLGQIFDKGVHLSFGQAPVQKYIDDVIRYLEEGKIKLDDVISHRLRLGEAPRAYEIFNDK